MAEQIKQLSAATTDEKKAAAQAIADAVKSAGPSKSADMFSKIAPLAAEKASKEGYALAFKAISEACPDASQPYLVDLLPKLVDLLDDKVKDVQVAADEALAVFVQNLHVQYVRGLLPVLFSGMVSTRKWQSKLVCVKQLQRLFQTAKKQMAFALPDIIPPLTEVMWDTRVEVQNLAKETMTEICNVVANKDLDPFIPVLVSALAKPSEIPECVHALSATTFVQTVDAPTLSVMCPILIRGLRERSTPVKRKAALIIDNMSKLVENPEDVAPFLPKLLPELEIVKENISDPECRNVATKAYSTLKKVGGEGVEALTQKTAEAEATSTGLKEVIGAKAGGKKADDATVSFLSLMACQLIDFKDFEEESWVSICKPFLLPFLSEPEIKSVATEFKDRCYKEAQEKIPVEDEEEGEDLCNCEFSLAYGGKILLNNATLHLKRGQRYGLCGQNGCGKSTLMRAIANDQLEGFPPPTELKTVYVEHDIDAEKQDFGVLEYTLKEPKLQGMDPKKAEEILRSVGFDDDLLKKPITGLSGGWKMKLALARAMMIGADILLLDEPTNHLDVSNVQWLENYLTSLTNCTCMIVSHDSGFLDNVCTHILHYENRKLKKYRGNLSEFVKQCPEAKSYYELDATPLKFTFPEPGYLEGVNDKGKALLKMTQCTFQYPTADKPTLANITVQCSLSSRVACIGKNGAGKSTLIKMLTGETEPTSGSVWRHTNMRIAYLAQHAFHHIEKHLDKTPNEYIQWRYATGEDKEDLEKVHVKVTDEEQKAMDQQITVDGVKRVVENLVGRRKTKKTYEYEVQWKGLDPTITTWLPRYKLEDLGFSKLIAQCDAKEAAKAGLVARPLTQKNVEKHLEDFGLEAEFGTHSRMRGLSGGQKVKVVLAAAMWNKPHMLVLDEPTNYLDRDSLGALANAIKEYGGGVVIISHNLDFCKGLCPEVWTVADGTVTPTGHNWNAKLEKLTWKAEEETTDALGNTVKVKAQKKKLSRKEMKARAKARKARIERGEEVSSEEEDFDEA
uniref:Elongation factor 3 n=1 Tax=Tetraselmis sp. GSL018 TaxID=582737 RepID=A0A061R1D1_9CHLO